MGEVKCRINIHGNVREYVPETTYKQLAKEYQKQFPDDIVLVLVNNRLRELRERQNQEILPLLQRQTRMAGKHTGEVRRC